jgi:hypothetical protein
MKIRYITILFSFLSLILLFSCNNEVDIYDENYKEVTVVYGLLDPGQTKHYLKITKAYQTEGSVIVAADNPENSQYAADELEVWVDVFDANGYYDKTFYFDTCLIKNKKEGDFYAPEQIVYESEEVVLNDENEYELFIKNKNTGKMIDASTYLINDFSIREPFSGQTYLSFTGLFPQSVKWNSAVNGRLYDLTFRFYYTEVDGQNTSSHYVDWYIGKTRASHNNGGESMGIEYVANGFYSNLEANIKPPESDNIKRYSDSIDLIINVADEVLTTYMDINAPSNSIVQDKPQFTNVTNGIGVFASRFKKIRRFDGLVNRSLDTLYNGIYTKDLGFVSRPF